MIPDTHHHLILGVDARTTARPEKGQSSEKKKDDRAELWNHRVLRVRRRGGGLFLGAEREKLKNSAHLPQRVKGSIEEADREGKK